MDHFKQKGKGTLSPLHCTHGCIWRFWNAGKKPNEIINTETYECTYL